MVALVVEEVAVLLKIRKRKFQVQKQKWQKLLGQATKSIDMP
jgi:hypothetical protein